MRTKRTVFYLCVLFLAILTITGCKKNDDAEKGKSNYLDYAGTTHEVTNAAQLFYGHYFGSNSNNVSLILATDEHYVGFEMFIPNSETKIVAGVYQPSDNYQSFTLAGGVIVDDGGSIVYSMKTATVTVKLSGNTYTIDIDGKLDDDSSIKGNYTGPIVWEDDSDSSPS